MDATALLSLTELLLIPVEKRGVINNLLDTVRLNVKILNDAGFNGDVFAIVS